MVYSDPVLLEEQGTDDVNASFSEDSLAAADSLALSPENEFETSLPSDGFDGSIYRYGVVKQKKKKRRRVLLRVSACLLVGIIVVLSVVLTKSKRTPEQEVVVGVSIDSAEASVQTEQIIETGESSEEEVIILGIEPLPDLYYQLESKVSNPAALLDMNTPEGKAYNFLVEESKAKQSPSTRSIEDLDLQRYALLVLYFGSDGGAWASTDGWLTPIGACGAWHGVTCRDSLVTGIDLDRNNLHGKIPDDFCLMTGLQTLRLSGNHVELPSCFSTLSNLEELDFRGNGFAGELPIDLYAMPSITSLELSDNEFVGSIDSLFPELSLSDEPIFPNLKTLDIANNNLTGEIPENMLRRMNNLDSLGLHGNPKLTGSLNEICKGDGIGHIDADCNMVSCKCCTSGNNCPSSL